MQYAYDKLIVQTCSFMRLCKAFVIHICSL